MVNESALPIEANRNWIYTLAIVLVFIFIYGFFYSTNTVTDIAFLFGQGLVLALFIVLILTLISPKKTRNPNIGVAFIIILTSLVVAQLIAAKRIEKDLKQSVTEIKNAYAEVYDDSVDENGFSQRSNKKVEEKSTSSGPAAKIEVYIKSLLNKAISLKNDYLLEMDAIGWDSILDPKRLSEDKTLIKSKVMIESAREIVEKYRAKHYDLLNEMRSNLTKLDINDSIKREVIKGFDKSLPDSKTLIKHSWEYEEMLVKEYGNVLNLLSAKSGTWLIENNKIMFSAQEDLDTYNSYILTLESIAEKQQKFHNETHGGVMNNFNEMLK